MEGKKRTFLATLVVSIVILCVYLAQTSVAGKSFPIDPEGSCVTEKCHPDVAKGEYVHAALDDGSCTDCHDAKKEDVHEFSLSAEGNELCAQCHEEIADKKHVHSAITEGECTDCHNPHASDFPNHLVANPDGVLCFSCHEEENFNGNFVHKPVSQGNCVGCHSPHSTDQPNQVYAGIPDLCFSCHSMKDKIKKGKAISSVKELYESEELPLHAPFADGECLECHTPHSSGNPILLASKGPVKIFTRYDESNYELCFNCHEEMKESLSERVDPDGTGFRNGSQNLHYLHVVEKGRSCRSCHNPHGTKNEKLIRNLIPFGKKSLRMKFSLTENGGSCAPPCHFKKDYDRVTPVENRR